MRRSTDIDLLTEALGIRLAEERAARAALTETVRSMLVAMLEPDADKRRSALTRVLAELGARAPQSLTTPGHAGSASRIDLGAALKRGLQGGLHGH